jgi:hypothetical protein
VKKRRRDCGRTRIHRLRNHGIKGGPSAPVESSQSSTVDFQHHFARSSTENQNVQGIKNKIKPQYLDNLISPKGKNPNSFKFIKCLKFQVFVFLTIVAAASAMSFGLGAPLLSKVSYQPTEYTHVRPEVTVQQPEYTYKSYPVPVPVAQPYYTAPVVRNFIAAPQFHAYPGLAAPLVY